MSITVNALAAELGVDPDVITGQGRALLQFGDQKVLTVEPEAPAGEEIRLTDDAAEAIRLRVLTPREP